MFIDVRIILDVQFLSAYLLIWEIANLNLMFTVSLGFCKGYLVALSITNRLVACNFIFSFFIYRDASWEKGDAFADLLFQYSRCDAEKCICPNGREHEQRSGYR